MQEEQQPAQAAILLDLDGVLCENTFRREHGNEKDFEVFGKNCAGAAPKEDFILLARALAQDGVAVFILTARSETLRARTESWLREWNVPADRIFMRPPNDNTADCVLKKKMLHRLKRKYALMSPGGLLPLLAVDDEPAVVKMYKDAGLPAYLPADVPEVLV